MWDCRGRLKPIFIVDIFSETEIPNLKRGFQGVEIILRVRTLKLYQFRKICIADFLTDNSLPSKNAKDRCIVFTGYNHWFGIKLTAPFICNLGNNWPQLSNLNCFSFVCPATPLGLSAIYNLPILPC